MERTERLGGKNIIKKLHSGYIANCVLCESTSGFLFFAKYYKFTGNPKDEKKHRALVSNEYKILDYVGTEVAVKPYVSAKCVFTDGEVELEVYCIITEFFPNGDLSYLIEKSFRFIDWVEDHEEITRYIFKKILNMITIIHKKGVYHLDIKPENIVIRIAKEPLNVEFKFIDFAGSQAFIPTGQKGIKTSKIKKQVGTNNYMAPEVNANCKYEPAMADIFSAGVTLYVLNARSHMSPICNETSEYSLLQKNEYETFWDIQSIKLRKGNLMFSVELMSLINGMILNKPEERLTIGEIINHPWVTMPSRYTDQEIMQKICSILE